MPRFLSQKITSMIKWWWFDTTKLWRGLLRSSEQKECPTMSLKMNFGLVRSLSLMTSRGVFFFRWKGEYFQRHVFKDMLSASFRTKWKYSAGRAGDQWYFSHVFLPALAVVLELKPPGWDFHLPCSLSSSPIRTLYLSLGPVDLFRNKLSTTIIPAWFFVVVRLCT